MIAVSTTQIKVTNYLYEGKHEQITVAYSKTNIETVSRKQLMMAVRTVIFFLATSQ